MTLDRFAALQTRSPTALGLGPATPDARVFAEGYAPRAPPIRSCHARTSATTCAKDRRKPAQFRTTSACCALGTRLWREGRRDRESVATRSSGWVTM